MMGAATASALAGPVLAALPPAAAVRNVSEPFTARSSDGVNLVGEAQGDRSAPEILFIHGLRQSRLSWEKQFADPALPGFRLVGFDLRGHGDSDKPASPDAYAAIDRWADDVAAVIAAAGLRRPVIVGWSLGGYVAGAYLRKYGGARVAGVNLVDAVTKLSPELLTPLAGAFTETASSHDLAERTAATADFLAACFHRQPNTTEFQRMLVINGMTARGQRGVRPNEGDRPRARVPGLCRSGPVDARRVRPAGARRHIGADQGAALRQSAVTLREQRSQPVL